MAEPPVQLSAVALRLVGHIGQTALDNGLVRIVTWNVGHIRSLFPELEVVDPTSD